MPIEWSLFGYIIASRYMYKSVLETKGLGAGKTNSGMGHQKLRPGLVSIVDDWTDGRQ